MAHLDTVLQWGFWIFFCGILGLFLVVFVGVNLVLFFAKRDPAKRRKDLEAFAAENGLRFSPDGSDVLAARLATVPPFGMFVVKKYVNVFEGAVDGRSMVLFDYEVGSASAGNQAAHREVVFYHTACLSPTGLSCPDLVIRPRRLDDKVLNSFGCEEIAFESVEFSKVFRVKSSSRKFAYDVCHPRMMELLLANRRWHVQLTGGLFLLLTERESKPEELRAALDFAKRFLDLIPDFVHKEYQERAAGNR